ncbi:MAG: vWA domain-containing protein [Planctomycetaceae bacterium]
MKRGSAPRATLPLLAALLAAAGALLPGKGGGRWDGPVTILLDTSLSCAAPFPEPEGAHRFADSDLGSALRGARIPGRARLLTDGCDPAGVAPAPPAGLVVDVHLLERRDHVGIQGLALPARVAAGEPFSLEVEVGRTEGAQAAERVLWVALERDGAAVGAPQAFRLDRGGRARARFWDRVDREGVVRFRARLGPGPGGSAEDEREATLRVGDRPLALVIGGSVTGGTLETIVLRPDEVASRLADRAFAARLDAILLGPSVLPLSAQDAIAALVDGGAGLCVVGAGAREGEPLARLLPLTATPPGGRSVVLALDYSGSMTDRTDALVDSVRALLALLDPADRVAYVLFRGSVESAARWESVGDPAEALRAIVPRGNTRLLPALEAAARLFEQAAGRQLRFYVVSDGAWLDPSRDALRERILALEAAGASSTAILVGEGQLPVDLFRRSFRAADAEALQEALARAEAEHPERRIAGPLRSGSAASPQWLAGAALEGGEFREIERLYPKGMGERIVLTAGEVPLVGAWASAPRVVQLAADPSANPSLASALPAVLAACARPTPSGRVSLTATRDGAALLLEARSAVRAAFDVSGVPIVARPAGPGRFRARQENPERGALRVSYLDAEVVVPPAEAQELFGLSPCRGIAASIALSSGGRFSEGPSLPRREVGSRSGPGPQTCLLGALLCLVCGAWRRRRA